VFFVFSWRNRSSLLRKRDPGLGSEVENEQCDSNFAVLVLEARTVSGVDRLGLVSSSVANYVVAIPASFRLAERAGFQYTRYYKGSWPFHHRKLWWSFFYLETCNQMAIYVPIQRLSNNIIVT